MRMKGFVEGHPTTVSCEISVTRSKYFLEFSITTFEEG